MKSKYFLMFFFIILLVISLPSMVSADTCTSCHGTDGGYTFEPLQVQASTPRVVSPGEEFNHLVIIEHPGNYDATNIKVEINLALTTQLTLVGKGAFQLEPMSSGKEVIIFTLKAGEPSQSQMIRTVVTYISSYHYDPTEFKEILDISVNIDKILLKPSEWSMDLKESEKKSITLTALEDVKNINILTSSSLDEISNIEYLPTQSLTKGDSIDIVFKGKDVGSGKLNVIYEDTEGVPHKITLDITVLEKSTDAGMLWVNIGIITGILSWSVLFISVLVGAPLKKLKSKLNKIFKTSPIRKEFHCGISYIITVLVLLHAVVVMANRWYGVVLFNSYLIANPSMEYGTYINLGTIAWFFMLGVSVTGIFWKKIIKLIKYNAWRWTHNIITLIALIVSSIHVSIMLHFRFL